MIFNPAHQSDSYRERQGFSFPRIPAARFAFSGKRGDNMIFIRPKTEVFVNEGGVSPYLSLAAELRRGHSHCLTPAASRKGLSLLD